MYRICLSILAFFSALHAALSYPETRKEEVIDHYHGVFVKDPYRHLEEQESAETLCWIDAQNAFTEEFLSTVSEREKINKRLTELYQYDKMGFYFQVADQIFYTQKRGLQNQPILYMQKGFNSTPIVVVDPNLLSEEGTIICRQVSVDPKRKYIAYELSDLGSDWGKICMKELETLKDLEDVITQIKLSNIVWHPTIEGFYYQKFEGSSDDFLHVSEKSGIYFHEIGKKAFEDELVFTLNDESGLYFWHECSDDSRYLVISAREGCSRETRIYLMSLEDKSVIPLFNEKDADYQFVGSKDDHFWFITDKDAPNKRLIAVDLKGNIKETIPETKESIENVHYLSDRFVVEFLRKGCVYLKEFTLEGVFEQEIDLPGEGSIDYFYAPYGGKCFFYTFTTYTTPPTVYQYDFETGTTTVVYKPNILADLEQYETKLVYYPSHDHVMIPMTLSYKKGLVMNENTPIYLYGYGGFGISITPMFSFANIWWMEQGGVFAVAHIRGGGEYGKEWHLQGKLFQKENCFSDFIGGAEWLIQNKWTSKDKIAIAGASNGGLLVGACMTKRPDLFKAAIVQVGVLDMLRFQKFTVGWGWIPEYGSIEDPLVFRYIYDYSPLHNIKKGVSYPATLILTADHDDRVVPLHSYKFAATLQEHNEGDSPILIRIAKNVGHMQKVIPTEKIIKEQADKWAFLVSALNLSID